MAEEQDDSMDERGMELIAEAGKIFWTYGIRSVTMDDLATRMGISKKTLYQYVSDKNDLVDKVLDHVLNEFKEHVAKASQGVNAIDELFNINSAVSVRLKNLHPSIHFDLEKYHPTAFRHMMETRRRDVRNITEKNLRRGIEEGLYRNDLNIAIISKLYVSRFEVVFDGDLFPAGKFPPEEVHWELFRYHIRGIASQEGVEYLMQKAKQVRQER